MPAVLRGLQAWGIAVRPLETTYYLGRETLIGHPDKKPRPARMRRRRSRCGARGSSC